MVSFCSAQACFHVHKHDLFEVVKVHCSVSQPSVELRVTELLMLTYMVTYNPHLQLLLQSIFLAQHEVELQVIHLWSIN